MQAPSKALFIVLGISVIGATAGKAWVSGSAKPVVATTTAGSTAGVVGPDVYCADIYEIERWGQLNGITAFSLGTISCNQGDAPVLWIDNTPEHPVIATQFYRHHNNRFEQVGLSWVKHGFAALDENFCGQCNATGSSTLGVNCSDPYTAGLNGFQMGLGPRNEINGATGDFPYPPGGGWPFGTINRRLQIQNSDLDPALYPGAIYIGEATYIAADDIAAGNGLNNASYRPYTSSGSGSTFNLNEIPGEGTRPQQPAIFAWQELDPTVTIETVVIPNDGVMYLGYKVVDNGNGTWDYEYALYNYSSDRAARAFAIPIPAGVNLTNVGFHDVDYHSGDPYVGTDWKTTTLLDHFIWYTASFTGNPNANALRWGTLYNFRFTADSPPSNVNGVIGTFKPGTQNRIFVAAQGPS